MNNVSFNNQTNEDIKEIETLEKLIHYAIVAESLEGVYFDVTFINNDEMKKLNKTYRDIDKTTDVLSFAFEDNNYIRDNKVRLLGDIYISIDKAHDQSQEYGHSYLRELSFLLIHGFLHLLGYDHMNEEDEKKMFKRQEEILDGFGIKR